ncbi:MAG: hypothetical protein II644_02380 [Paludibacteraceae bacterium]|nr:hypothetical protein [Paludibacteraceae bacterium]
MTLSTAFAIVAIIDIIVFTAYELGVVLNFCIPNNLSNTYYHFDRKHRGYGKLFPAMLYFLCVTALPMQVYYTLCLDDWRRYCAFLPALTTICLALVGLSARYKKSDFRIYFHYTVAILAGFFTVVWFLTVGLKLSYVLIVFILVMMITGALTRTLRLYPLFWFETAGFYAVLFAVLIISLVPNAL